MNIRLTTGVAPCLPTRTAVIDEKRTGSIMEVFAGPISQENNAYFSFKSGVLS